MKHLFRAFSLAALVIALPALAGLALWNQATAAERAPVLPKPALDPVGPSGATPAVALFAGGCFWGVQGVFQHVNGVLNAISGYAGGDKATARYEIVGSGTTGHAETVQVLYDPRQITFGRLLQIFFSVVHDPTELNRQGPDTGTEYRSAIFAATAEQAKIATAYIAQLDQLHAFNKPIVTAVEGNRAFYPAEPYHQNFLTENTRNPYIIAYDLPKIDDLKRLFPDVYRSSPVLVTKADLSR
jgi:peptide-methionine (S)-S-oxide reductase